MGFPEFDASAVESARHTARMALLGLAIVSAAVGIGCWWYCRKRPLTKSADTVPVALPPWLAYDLRVSVVTVALLAALVVPSLLFAWVTR